MSIPRWRLALTIGALVVLGAVGSSLVQAAASPSGPSAGGADAAAAAAADSALQDALALTSDPGSSGSATPVQLLALRDRIQQRIANVRGRLVHGTLTVLDRDGKLATYQLDHGTVSSVGSASVTIAEAGQTSTSRSTPRPQRAFARAASNRPCPT